MTKYSFKKGLYKILEGFITFGLPFLVSYLIDLRIDNPAGILGNLTVGAILRGIANAIKIWYANRQLTPNV